MGFISESKVRKSIRTEKDSTFSRRNSFARAPFFQTKLTVGPSDDIYEKEADAMADTVMRITDGKQIEAKISPVTIQTKCANCEEEERLQRKANNKNAEHAWAPAIAQEVINSTGKSLDENTQSFMESRFGYDFSKVKIHTDMVAAKSAESINALAYTSGNNIVFNEGQFALHTDNGKRLSAHELTHVVQQKNAALQKRLQRQDTGEEQEAPVVRDDFEYHYVGPCFRPYFPGVFSGGTVTFRGCSGDVSDFSLISENRNPDGSCILITPVDGITYSIDGFWYRHHTPMNEWFKIGDHCDVIVDCSMNRIEICCNVVLGGLGSWLRGRPFQPYWTGENYGICTNPFSADPTGSNCNSNPLGSTLPPVGTAHRRPPHLLPCAMTLAQIQADPAWCLDYFQSHRGETCYRRIPSVACGPSDQYCFTDTGCCHSSPDTVSPVDPSSSGAGATCDNNAWCVAQHTWEDVL